MPYFMDFHVFDKVSVEEVKQAHMADVSVQRLYGVNYHQFWVNEEMGTVFCLIEGPDADACQAVHREAHGNIACNLTEVNKDFFEQFMGRKQRLDHGLVLNAAGQVDSGQRYLMVVDLITRTRESRPESIQRLLHPSRERKLLCDLLREFGGAEVNNPWNDSILAVFSDAQQAISAAVTVKNRLAQQEGAWFRLGLGVGQPLTEVDGFFEQSMEKVSRLNIVADRGEIILDPEIPLSGDLLEVIDSDSDIRRLTPVQVNFIADFFTLCERHLDNPKFSVGMMSDELGVSRPQLYRRITDLTGRSPNQFLRDFRLRRALSLIRENRYNISEIAYEVGFGNPSYFSRRFQEKYGIAPSRAAG